MTSTEPAKILDDKIKANKAQYYLDREGAEISALSSGELEKYEYLPGEDLGYKPDVIQKGKFEYSPLGKRISLDESDKKEGLLKKVKNIEGKNEQQLEAIKDQGKKQSQILAKKKDQVNDFKNMFFRNKLNSEAKKAYDEIRGQSRKIDYTILVCIGSGNHQYNFTIFLDLKTFAESLCSSSLSLKVAKLKQRNMEHEIKRLEDYYPKKEKLGHKKKILFIMQENFTKEGK